MVMVKYAIGIDIGGTKIEGVLANSSGKILFSFRHDVGNSKSEIITNLNDVLDKVISYSKSKKIKLSGVGVSLPGNVDSKGRWFFAGGALKKMIGTNIVNLISKKTKLKVYADNDANCFLRAETSFGKYSSPDMVGIIWGTGIGCAIISNGSVVKGMNGLAGEIGHIKHEDIPVSKFEGETTFESIASGKHILRRYNSLSGKSIDGLTVHDIYKLEKFNEISKQVMYDAINTISDLFVMLIRILNPTHIVVGGGVSNLDEKVFVRIRSNVKKKLPAFYTCKIVKTSLFDSAGSLGATTMVFDK